MTFYNDRDSIEKFCCENNKRRPEILTDTENYESQMKVVCSLELLVTLVFKGSTNLRHVDLAAKIHMKNNVRWLGNTKKTLREDWRQRMMKNSVSTVFVFYNDKKSLVSKFEYFENLNNQ